VAHRLWQSGVGGSYDRSVELLQTPVAKFRRAAGGTDMSRVLQEFSHGLGHVPGRGSPPGWRLRGPAGGSQCCR